MGVEIEESEMAMALLIGLPDRFDGLISALNALGNDEKLFTFDFLKSRCQKEEQRHKHRDNDARIKSETAALLGSREASLSKFMHCGRKHKSNKCWKKYSPFALSWLKEDQTRIGRE